VTESDQSISDAHPEPLAAMPTLLLEGFSSIVRQTSAITASRPDHDALPLPQLERFLQHAQFQEIASQPTESLAWLCATGQYEPPPVAALCRLIDAEDQPSAEHSERSEAHWLRADPVWLRADLTRVYLAAVGNLSLSHDECAALADELRPWLAELDVHIDTSHPQRWYIRLPAESQAELPNPLSVVGAGLEDLWLQRDVAAAAGYRFDHPFWLRLSNEVQMLLHAHPMNEQRRQMGMPEANSLWIWGGGQLPASCQLRQRVENADQIMLKGMARWQQKNQAAVEQLPGLWHWCPQPGETPNVALVRLEHLFAQSSAAVGQGMMRVMTDEGELWQGRARPSWWQRLPFKRRASLLDLLPQTDASTFAAKAGL